MTDERIFEQDDLRGMTPAEIVDEVSGLRFERGRWREIAGQLALLLQENVAACLNDDCALCDDVRVAMNDFHTQQTEDAVMGRCRDCKWWLENPLEMRPPGLMVCTSMPGIDYSGDLDDADDPTFPYCDDSFGRPVVLVTGPDFGCVKFEAREP